MTNQKQIRNAFWEGYADVPGISKIKIPNFSGNKKIFNTQTRCAFADFVDHLAKSGEISKSLAERVTL